MQALKQELRLQQPPQTFRAGTGFGLGSRNGSGVRDVAGGGGGNDEAAALVMHSSRSQFPHGGHCVRLACRVRMLKRNDDEKVLSKPSKIDANPKMISHPRRKNQAARHP